jgi:hypothetical protein
VIEDAKALGKFVIASDIAVHREQLSAGVAFFAPDNAAELARLMSQPAFPMSTFSDDDDVSRRREYARTLDRLIAEVTRDFKQRRVDELTISPPDFLTK